MYEKGEKREKKKEKRRKVETSKRGGKREKKKKKIREKGKVSVAESEWGGGELKKKNKNYFNIANPG